jgi:cytochrome c oxidase cbb3-type subunit III
MRGKQILGCICLLSAGAAILPIAWGQDTHDTVNQEMAKPVIRGSIVYKYYCVLCHGERGDGNSRGAKLHPEEQMTIKPAPAWSYENIIRKGGEAIGVSPTMPPWQDELSSEQISDLVAYLAILGDAVRRGEVVFKTNCVLCHGLHGDGRGRAARLYNPPPADLTQSDKNDEYKEAIIRKGGEAMRRSAAMPVWKERLSESEIADVIAYLRTILVTTPGTER